MTNEDILNIALQQSAYDCNCDTSDFLQYTNKVVISKKNAQARKYFQSCNDVGVENQFTTD